MCAVSHREDPALAPGRLHWVQQNYLGALNDIAGHQAGAGRIQQHWDDMLRVAGSLKLGTVQASELVRSFLRSERPSSLASAIMELGRINKTPQA